MLRRVEIGDAYADNVLDEAEDAFERAEAAGLPTSALSAMAAVLEALKADDLQHGVPRESAISAVERAGEVERLVTGGPPARVLTIVRGMLRCPSLNQVVAAHRKHMSSPG